jgi:hypothetical protein
MARSFPLTKLRLHHAHSKTPAYRLEEKPGCDVCSRAFQAFWISRRITLQPNYRELRCRRV